MTFWESVSVHNNSAVGYVLSQVKYATYLCDCCRQWVAEGMMYTVQSLGLPYPSSKSSVAVLCLLLNVISAIDRPISGHGALCQISAGLPANLVTSPQHTLITIQLSLSIHVLFPPPTDSRLSSSVLTKPDLSMVQNVNVTNMVKLG